MSLEAAIQENTSALREVRELFAKFMATSATSLGVSAEPKKSVQAPAPVASQATAKPVAETAAPKQTADESSQSAASAVDPAPASTAAIDYATVAQAINAAVSADRPRAVAVLAKFGAKKGPDLKPEQYADFLKELA